MVNTGKGKFKDKREKPEFDQHILDLARVTRVTKGGKQLSFRACVVIGDRNGRVAFGVDKGKDVQIAVEKAVNQAKKDLIRIPLHNQTLPHRVEAKFKAARVMLKPAPMGSGIIAGGPTRIVLEMAGVPNASAKMLSKTNNKITNVKATFKALSLFKKSALKNAAPRVAAPASVVAPVLETKAPAKRTPVPVKKEIKKAE
jgi:small subunit ribosomal protein S5